MLPRSPPLCIHPRHDIVKVAAQAADIVRLVGIGRNEYIATMNKCKAKKLLWRVNRAIVKDLLPTEQLETGEAGLVDRPCRQHRYRTDLFCKTARHMAVTSPLCKQGPIVLDAIDLTDGHVTALAVRSA